MLLGEERAKDTISVPSLQHCAFDGSTRTPTKNDDIIADVIIFVEVCVELSKARC